MSQTGVVSWSQTAASNATADSNVNWAEGMAPSQVNDSARAGMASVAKYRDDHNGTLLTAGSSSAFTITSNQVFSSLAILAGQKICVRFNKTCDSNATLNIDSLGAKTISLDGTTNVSFGMIRANSIHHLTYDNSLGVFIIHSGHALVEPGRIQSHGSATAPNGWQLCDGSALSRTLSTSADLFASIGILWGNGDGSTTFNVPDLRGRFVCGNDPGNLRGFGATPIGTVGGSATTTLTTGNIPLIPFTATGTIGGSQTLSGVVNNNTGASVNAQLTGAGLQATNYTINGSNFSFTGTSTSIGNSSPGGFAIIPPVGVVNYIIKT